MPRPNVVDVTLPDGTVLAGVLRTYLGNLVRGKDPKAPAWIARWIAALAADVLCLQEVEDKDALDAFNRDDLGPLAAGYQYRVVVEGNDPRRIDAALCSRLPIVRISSLRYRPGRTTEPVPGRDLLRAEIQAPDGRSSHVFVSHLKSNYIPTESRSPQELRRQRDAVQVRRTAQAEAIGKILRRLRFNQQEVVCGDFNDNPDAATLAAPSGHGLVEQIQHDTVVPGPNHAGTLVADKVADLTGAMWTHRHRVGGQTSFGCYDRIWTSPDLPVTAAQVTRRTQISGDGSDRDPAATDGDL